MQPPTPDRHNLILLLAGLGLILIAGAAFLMLPGVLSPAAQPASPAMAPIVVDFPAPEVRLTDLQGQTVSLSDYRGRVILYNAWATWCPPCKAEMPILQAYYQAHQMQGFVVIAIEDGEPLGDVAAYAQNYGLTFPVWPDTKWVATNAFGIHDLPTSYVIDRAGTVRLTWFGPTTRALLEQYVSPLLRDN